MADLGSPQVSVLVARANLGIDEQELQIEKAELRLMELDDEIARVKADQHEHAAAADEVDASKAATPIEERRKTIKAHEHRLLINRMGVRLLEIDDEKHQVAVDIKANRAHIERLRKELAQQQERLQVKS